MGLLNNIYRHPVAATTVGGALIAAKDVDRKAKEQLVDVVKEQVGPGKYACEELTKFAAEKEFLYEKLAGPHLGDPWGHSGDWYNRSFGDHSIGDAFTGGLGKALGSELVRAGFQAIGQLVGGTASSIKNRLFLDPRREEMVDTLITEDPIISIFEENNPGSTLKAYKTLAEVAPSLSLNPHVTTSFLRSTAQSDGNVDFMTIKLLADAEAAVNRAKNPNGGSHS